MTQIKAFYLMFKGFPLTVDESACAAILRAHFPEPAPAEQGEELRFLASVVKRMEDAIADHGSEKFYTDDMRAILRAIAARPQPESAKDAET